MSTQSSITLDYTPQRTSRIPAWLSSSFWAVCDQGLFAISNMILNVLLYRWLVDTAPRDYGAFTVAFAIFLLFGTLHNAFLIEPMLVFGNAHYLKRLPSYFGLLVCGEVVFGIVSAVLLGISAFCAYHYHSVEMAQSLGSMALASPFILFLWLMRRACYVKLEPRRAAFAGAGYLMLMLAGLFSLKNTGHLSVFTACVVMAASSLAAGLWLAFREGVSISPDEMKKRTEEPRLVDLAMKDHWHYGRWAAAAGLVGYIPSQVSYLILPLFYGLEDSGSLRALTNLVMPFLQANAALCLLLLPRLVRARGTPAYAKTVRWATLFLAGGPIVYWVLLGLFNGTITHLLYDGRFDADSGLLWLIGLQPVFAALFGIYHAVLDSQQRPDYVFYASLASAIASLTIGVVMTKMMGLKGVAWASIIALALNFIVAYLLTKRLSRDGAPLANAKSHGDDVPAHVPLGTEEL